MTAEETVELVDQLEKIAESNGVALYQRPGSILRLFELRSGKGGELTGEYSCYFTLSDCFGAMLIPKKRSDIEHEALKTIQELKAFVATRAQ